MKCLYCGEEYADISLKVCPKCGKKFIQRLAKQDRDSSEDEVEETIRMNKARARAKAGLMRECPYCKKSISREATICPSCGGPISDADRSEGDLVMPRRQGSSAPIIGGILLLIVGIAGAIVGAMLVSMGSLAESIGLASGYSGLGGMVTGIGGLGIFLSLGVIAGGYFAIRRSNFVLTIIGAVIALLIGIASPYFVGSIMGFIALISIAMSHSEFE